MFFIVELYNNEFISHGNWTIFGVFGVDYSGMILSTLFSMNTP